MSEGARARAPTLDALAAQRWCLPTVEGPIVGGRPNDDNARERQQADERAQRSAHALGYEAGLAAGRAEMQARLEQLAARVQRLDEILQFMAEPLRQLDSEVQRELALLALAIGKQLARRDLASDPAQVIAIIRDCVGRLPAGARDVHVRLHPEDAAVVRECLASPAGGRAWTIVEDPTLSRGGCIVRADTSRIDARLESRLNALVSSILGEERAAPRSAPDTDSE